MAVRSFFHSSASLAGRPEAITLGKSSTRGLDCNCKVSLITIITIIGYQNETVVNHCKTNKQRVQQTSYWHNKSSWSNTYVHEGHAGLESSNLLQYGEFSSVLELEQFNVEFRLLRTPVTNDLSVHCTHSMHRGLRDIHVCHVHRLRYVLGILGVLLLSSGVLGRSGISLRSLRGNRGSLSCIGVQLVLSTRKASSGVGRSSYYWTRVRMTRTWSSAVHLRWNTSSLLKLVAYWKINIRPLWIGGRLSSADLSVSWDRAVHGA